MANALARKQESRSAYCTTCGTTTLHRVLRQADDTLVFECAKCGLKEVVLLRVPAGKTSSKEAAGVAADETRRVRAVGKP